MGSLSVTLQDNLRVLKGWNMEEEVVRRKGAVVLGFQASVSCSCWQSGVRRCWPAPFCLEESTGMGGSQRGTLAHASTWKAFKLSRRELGKEFGSQYKLHLVCIKNLRCFIFLLCTSLRGRQLK